VRAASAIPAALFAVSATLLAGAALSACATESPASTDPCAKAIERLTDECNFTVDGADAGTQLNCTGSAACAADCLFTVSCNDIKNDRPAFKSCIDACGP
jgi:hypothetical protein